MIPYLFTVIALIIGNFLYEIVTKKNWGKAWEISYFQFVAIGVLYFTIQYLG